MLNQDYKDILFLFIKHEVDFLLIGAYAMAVHGFPRATADIDIFIKPDGKNSKRIVNALTEFGAPQDNISVSDFETPGVVIQIGIAPRRIDLISEIDGLTFDEASDDKEVIETEGLSIPVISKEKLIINKLATGREQDRLDAENLKNSLRG